MTPNTQRIGIIVIAVIMLVGTLGSFAMFVLANDNAVTEQERLTREYQEMIEAQQKEMAEQTEKLTNEYLAAFKEHEGRVSEFDAEAVGEEVTHIDLKEGDGELIGDDSVYRVFYMGWNPKGKMFDSSFTIDKTGLSLPLGHRADGMWEFPGGQVGNVIEGWEKGVIGMKIGGVREITIPSDLGYGELGGSNPADIPPNTPLKFIIMAIPAVEA